MSGEEKILYAKLKDCFRLSEKYQAPRFTSFLNEAEQEIIKKYTCEFGSNYCFFGGFENAQRKLLGVFPDWQEPCFDEFPISAIKITKKYQKTLSHRDYLGTILSLGIDRIKVGDILINDDDDCYVFVLADIADYILGGISKISNVGIKTMIIPLSEVLIPEVKFQEIYTVSASLRLDAVVASVLNVSRKTSSNLIQGLKVSVNHTPTTDTSYNLKPNDIISVRGYGRFIFSSQGHNTRSNRIHICVKKYI